MSLHYYAFHTTIKPNTLDATAEEDGDLVRFDISFNSKVVIPWGAREVKSLRFLPVGDTVHERTSICIHRSKLCSRSEIVCAIDHFLGSAVPRRWHSRIIEELVSSARASQLAGDQLSNPGEPGAPLVEVRLRTLTLFKYLDDEGEEWYDGVRDIFEKLTIFTKESSIFAHVSEPATFSSVRALETVPLDRLQTDDRCPICIDDCGLNDGSLQVIRMPCSHKYHRNCIDEWLSVNHVCPLCRFRMPNEVIALFPRLNEDSAW